MTKVLRSVYVDSELVDRLKKLSRLTRVPQSVYVREGIDLMLNKYGRKKTKRLT